MTINKKRIMIIVVWLIIMIALISAFFVFNNKTNDKIVNLKEKYVCFNNKYYFSENCKSNNQKVICKNEKCEITDYYYNDIVIIDGNYMILYDYSTKKHKTFDIGTEINFGKLVLMNNNKVGFLIKHNNLYGFYDIEQEKVTVPMIYKSLTINDRIIDDNNIIGQMTNDLNNQYLISLVTGNILLVSSSIETKVLNNKRYYEIYEIYNNKYSLYNSKCKSIITDYYYIHYLDNQLYVSFDKKSYSKFNIDGNLIENFIYDNIYLFGEKFILANTNDIFYLLDYNDEIIHTFEKDINDEYINSYFDNSKVYIEFSHNNQKKNIWYDFVTKSTNK